MMENNILVRCNSFNELYIPNAKVICINTYFSNEIKSYYNNLPIKWEEYTIKNVYYRNKELVGITILELPNYLNNKFELHFDFKRFNISMFDFCYFNLN
jgi:hypothetical protein